MAHPRKEIAFGCIGLFRRHQGGCQLLLLPLFLEDHIRHIGAGHTNPLQLPADIKYAEPLNPRLTGYIPHFHDERIGIPLSQL